MIRHSRNASPTRPRHRSRPTLDRLEDRLQPNSLGGLWDDLALGRPTVAPPRPPEVAPNREHHARIGQAHHGKTTAPQSIRPIRARAHRHTTPPGSESPIPIVVIPTATSPTMISSPGPSPAPSPAPAPSSPVPTAPPVRPAPPANQPSPMPTSGPHTAGISPGWTSFADGSGGYTLTQWGPNGSFAAAIAMWTVPGSTTQRIVTAGTAGYYNMAVARYNTDGTLDTSFGSGGATTTVLSNYSQHWGMALQPDGKVVGAGSYQGFLAARYTVNGALDTTFNGTGWVSTAITRTSQGVAHAVGLQSTGKIVEAGSSSHSTILRYTSTGQLDSGKGGFGQAGKNGSPLGYTILSMGQFPNDEIDALAIQPDDKIVTAGRDYDDNYVNAQLTLMRFTANGLPDPTFNNGSPVLFPQGSSEFDEGRAVALHSDGKIVVAGDARTPGGGDPRGFLAARFNPDGSLDTTFNNGSGWIRVDVPSGGYYDTADGAAIDGSGRIVVGGSWQTSDGTTHGIAVTRLNADGTLDTSFGTGGIKSEVIPGTTNDSANALALGNDGNYYLAGSAYVNYPGPYSTLLAYFTP